MCCQLDMFEGSMKSLGVAETGEQLLFGHCEGAGNSGVSIGSFWIMYVVVPISRGQALLLKFLGMAQMLLA